jgi:hypothetical protein
MDELLELFEQKKLKKQDVKATERKMESDVTDRLGGNEIAYLNTFLKKGEMIDGKKYKSIDGILSKYKKSMNPTQFKTDANIQMLAPIIAAMISTLEGNK